MTKRDQSVKTYSGTPPATAFGASQGTPLVIDYTAATGYFMHPVTGAVTALGGGGGGGSGTVTSVGLSTPNSSLSLGGTNPVTTTGTISADLNLAHRNEWTAAQNVIASTLTDASTITPVASASNNFYLLTTNAVGGTRTIALPSGTLNAGDIVMFQIKQPASGGPCLVVFDPASYFWGQGGLSLQPTGSTANGASDLYALQVRADLKLQGVMVGQSGATGPGYLASSTTSLVTAGSGSKAFVTQAGLAYSAGARIRATSIGTGEYMEGLVTSYSASTLTVTMDTNSGTGTHADWNINLAGNVGSTGTPGTPGTTGPPGAPGAPSNGVNLQAGTTYTVVSGDSGKLVSFSNASAVAVTLPQATGSFTTPFVWDAENRGAGTVTITPTTSTIDGATSLVLTTSQGCRLFSDGSDWYTQRGVGGGTGGAAHAFHAFASAQTTLTAGSYIKVLFASKEYDTDSAYSTATSKWTPSAGKWNVFAQVRARSTTSITTSICEIRKNGSSYRSGSTGGVASSIVSQTNVSATVIANGTDFFEVYCYTEGGGTMTAESAVTGATYFGASLIGT